MKDYILTLSNGQESVTVEYDDTRDTITLNNKKIWNNGEDYKNMIIDYILDGYYVIDVAKGYKDSFREFLSDAIDDGDFSEHEYNKIVKIIGVLF